MEKHLFLPDFQIPDEDTLSIQAVLKFMADFKPTHLHLVGDLLNFTSISKYLKDPYYDVDLQDEVEIGRKVIKQVVKCARKANRKVEIKWYEGNHENRLIKYLGTRASELAKLTEDDNYMISVPNLFKLKDLGVSYIPYWKTHIEHGVIIEHGDMVRQHAGYTAKGMLDKRQHSGFSGHTHRLALHMQTHVSDTKFWIELGCLCKRNMGSPYVKDPNWQQGFAYAIYDGNWYPSIVPITNHSFYTQGKFYKG